MKAIRAHVAKERRAGGISEASLDDHVIGRTRGSSSSADGMYSAPVEVGPISSAIHFFANLTACDDERERWPLGNSRLFHDRVGATIASR